MTSHFLAVGDVYFRCSWYNFTSTLSSAAAVDSCVYSRDEDQTKLHRSFTLSFDACTGESIKQRAERTQISWRSNPRLALTAGDVCPAGTTVQRDNCWPARPDDTTATTGQQSNQTKTIAQHTQKSMLYWQHNTVQSACRVYAVVVVTIPRQRPSPSVP